MLESLAHRSAGDAAERGEAWLGKAIARRPAEACGGGENSRESATVRSEGAASPGGVSVIARAP